MGVCTYIGVCILFIWCLSFVHMVFVFCSYECFVFCSYGCLYFDHMGVCIFIWMFVFCSYWCLSFVHMVFVFCSYDKNMLALGLFLSLFQA